MKTYSKLVAIFALSIAAFVPSMFAQLAIPSDGSDGALIVSSNTVIDLSQAVTGIWSNNNAANAGKGIYDTNKWAVVFKYSNVVVSSGATLTFLNHPSHAPVVWLVSGNVTVNGVVSLNGADQTQDTLILPEGGPGGFRGGARNQVDLGYSGGFGPGGEYRDYGQYGYGQTRSYGNAQILPLIGGSGGSSDGSNNGSGGGGAILIAASGILSVSGSGIIRADAGPNGNWTGSGGGIRLVADQIGGSGRVEAVGAYPGRIRLEANTTSPALSLNPATVAVSPTPLLIWPDSNAPTVRVLSVAGQAAPADPKAVFSASGDDLAIANTNAVAILLQTANFPTNGTVKVYIKPRNSAQATLQASYVSGDTNQAIWQVTTVLPVSHTIIQARAVY